MNIGIIKQLLFTWIKNIHIKGNEIILFWKTLKI